MEEGLPGRTTVLDDPIDGIHKNGLTYLPPRLESHRPIDVVTIALGTNDLKSHFGMPPGDIAAGAGIGKVLGAFGQNAKVLLIAPADPGDRLPRPMFAGGAAKLQTFAGYYPAVAKRLVIGFLDAATFVASSKIDGIHLDPPEHQKLGKAVAAAVKDL